MHVATTEAPSSLNSLIWNPAFVWPDQATVTIGAVIMTSINHD